MVFRESGATFLSAVFRRDCATLATSGSDYGSGFGDYCIGSLVAVSWRPLDRPSRWRRPWVDFVWRRRAGDKIPVPEFDGEEQPGHEGSRVRGYLRRVNAWRRITRLKPCKQALALYNHLTGKAWRDGEEIDLDILDQDNGVDTFIDWISAKYLDREVVKVGRCMSEFFKVLKRTTGQDIKDFNQEFDRQASRLREVGCQLPDLCLAWW